MSNNRISKSIWLIAMAVITVALVFAGCSSTSSNRKILTFFFDGVPSSEIKSTTNVVAQASNADGDGIVALVQGFVRPAEWQEEVVYHHKPFQDDNCNACHESKFSQKMRSTEKDVCFSCHKDLLKDGDKKDLKVKHSPVDSGECSSCHNAHSSTNKFLLTVTGKNLCLECHDDFSQKGKSKHTPAASGDCLSCHDPHGSGHKGLAIKGGKDLCFECHDDFLAKAKHKHAPVDSGECLSCHSAHHSENKKLLLKKGNEMCWDCHDNFLEKAKFQHTAVGDCLDCHSAHHSAEKFLLTKNIGNLCAECHDAGDMDGNNGHKNRGAKTCVDCHDVHVGDNKHLLKASIKAMAPTAKLDAPPLSK